MRNAIAATAPLVRIGDIGIRQDAEGRYCLNDLHRAAGGQDKHKPSNFFRLDSTDSLINELLSSEHLVVAIEPLKVVRGASGGTFVVKELVYAYAMWISPAFHLRVIRAYDAMVKPQAPALNDPAALRDLLLGYTEKVLALEATVQEQAPKVAALDRIAGADGLLCITDAAKVLQVRPKDLFARLQSSEWIYKRPGCSTWTAHQRRLQQGVLEHKTTTIARADGSEKVVHQVLVTAKGLAKLSELMETEACAG